MREVQAIHTQHHCWATLLAGLATTVVASKEMHNSALKLLATVRAAVFSTAPTTEPAIKIGNGAQPPCLNGSNKSLELIGRSGVSNGEPH